MSRTSTRAFRSRLAKPLAVALLVALSGCAPPPDDDDDDDDGDLGGPPGLFGVSTNIVVVVNPVINAGSTTSVQPGDERQGIRVDVEGTSLSAVTDGTGLAVLSDVPTGEVTLVFESGSVTIDVQQARELYDVVVAVRPDGVEHIVPPVRYPISGDVAVLEPGSDVAEATAEDGAIVILKPGSYAGNFELRSEGTLLVGAWDPTDGSASVFEGDVTALGGNTRMRGLRIEGTLTTNANGFSAGFNELGGANVTGNDVSLIRNVFESDNASVPSSNAVLVDNIGIP